MNIYRCYRCGQDKEEKDFRWDKRRNKISRPCIECQLIRGREYHGTHRVQEKEYRKTHKVQIKQWFLDHPEHMAEYRSNYNRMYRIQKEYDMTPQEYDEMFKRQGGVCAICGKPETQAYNSTRIIGHLCIDHSHETGKIRGLLCMKCNRGVGLFQDDVALLQKAAEYLEGYGDS